MATFRMPSSKSSAFLAGRLTLVKDSFGGTVNRCQRGPLMQHDSTGQILEEEKSNFFFFLPAQSCHISSSDCEGILDRTSHLNNAKHRLDYSLCK